MATDYHRLVSAYVDLALAGERERALERALEPLLTGECELPDLHDRVFGPASARIGELWQTGVISVADEHLATRITEEALAAARSIAQSAHRAPARGRVVLACPADELHETGLRMLRDALEVDGWDARLLGAATPAQALAAHVRAAAPAAVALSCATPLAIPSLLLAVEAVREAAPGIPVVVGGRAVVDYPAVGRAADATASFATVREARQALPELLA